MALLWLPEARIVERGRVLTFDDDSDPKGVLHTTESPGRPSYSSWTVHPHTTVVPIPRVGVDVDQHVRFDRASFALRNLAGGVETNRDRAYQVELVGTCFRGGPGYRWYQADDAVLRDLARKVILPMRQLGIPLRAPAFQAYPASYGARGNTNTVRMTPKVWDTYNGWCGHQHVPENTHGDPGSFPWERLLELARELDGTPDPAPAPPRPRTPPAFPLPEGWYFGPEDGPRESVSGFHHRLPNGQPGHPGLVRLQARLTDRGWDLGAADGLFGPKSARVFRLFRRQLGLDDGVVAGVRVWNGAWTAPVTAD